MKIICYYNKNLKMSSGKLAAQIGHVCKELGKIIVFEYGHYFVSEDVIIVLEARNSKFLKKLEEVKNSKDWYYVQEDLGFTELEKGTITAFGYIE